MPKTVPNQRVVTIHREQAKKNFLGIQNENWQAAARDLGAQALLLYLYLAANADNFQLALSPAAIQNAVGMPPSTYRDQFKKLVEKGYLVEQNGNRYDFFEIPKGKTIAACDTTAAAHSKTADDYKETGDIREINNTNIHKIYNSSSERQASHAVGFVF